MKVQRYCIEQLVTITIEKYLERIGHLRSNRLAHTGEIMGGIAGGFLLIITAVLLVLYRNWKYEQELDSLLWKVNYKDIQIKEKKDESSGANEAPTKCNSKVNAWLRSLCRLIPILCYSRHFPRSN